MLKTGRATGMSSRTEGGERRWWILAVIGTAQLIVVLDATIVNIALPSAQADLGFDDGDRAWIVTAYALGFGSLLLPGGRVTDMIGRRAAFMAGLTGFAAASALGGAATGFTTLVAARALQGCFGALLAPAALALLTTTFDEGKDRNKAFAIFGAIAGSGSAIGLLLGGVLTEYLDWRWTLYVNLVFAAVAFLGAMVLLPRTPRDRTVKLDVLGTVLVSAGLFALVYGLATAERHGWSATSTRAPLIAGAVLLAAFLGWQALARHPLLPPRVVADRNRAASFLSVAVVGATMFAIFLFLTYYMQQDLGFTPVRTGLAFLPLVGALMVVSGLTTSVLLPRIGPKPVVPAAMAVCAAGMYWLTELDPSQGYLTNVLPPLIVIGAGCGGVFAPAMSLATYGVLPQDAGVAAATVNTTMQVGGSIGTALLNTLASTTAADYLDGRDHTDPAVLSQATLHGYSTVYSWSAVLLVAGCVLLAFLYRHGRQASADLPEWTADPWRSLLIAESTYRGLPRNVARTIEVVDGRVIYCDASPPSHQRVAWNLSVALRAARPDQSPLAVTQNPDMRFVPAFPHLDGQTGRFTIRRPDVGVLRAEQNGTPLTSQDVLVAVEISHPGSLTDFADKRAEYAFERIPVYLIVVMAGDRVHSIEEYRLDWSGRSYQVAAVHHEHLTTDLPGGIGLHLPFTDLERT